MQTQRLRMRAYTYIFELVNVQAQLLNRNFSNSLYCVTISYILFFLEAALVSYTWYLYLLKTIF